MNLVFWTAYFSKFGLVLDLGFGFGCLKQSFSLNLHVGWHIFWFGPGVRIPGTWFLVHEKKFFFEPCFLDCVFLGLVLVLGFGFGCMEKVFL